MAEQKHNPTLFDKLVGDLKLEGLREEDVTAREAVRASMRFYTVPRLERFNEAALKTTIKRELNWLLNTTNLDAAQPLDQFPEVRTSVLNYGVPDLTGKSLDPKLVLQRGREIREAIETFEPRLDRRHLTVEIKTDADKPNAVTYIVHSDITEAVDALPVEFKLEVEHDQAVVNVFD